MIYYTIISTAYLPSLVFSDLLNNSEKDLTYNNDKTLCIVKFQDNEPNSLQPIPKISYNNRLIHNHSEILELKQLVAENLAYGWIKTEGI